MGDGTTSSVVLSAIGALLGYFGSSLASETTFSRLLFPTRFYNVHTLHDFLGITFLMPLGGPTHKAAVQILDQLSANGLFAGYCRGGMLGSAFFDDMQQKYYLIDPGSDNEEVKDARNFLWYRVLELLLWQIPEGFTRLASQGSSQGKEGLPSERNAPLKSMQPCLHLRLEYDVREPAAKNSETRKRASNSKLPTRLDLRRNPPSVSGDLGPINWRTIAGILCSESVAMITGACTLFVWRSPYSIWFTAPLVLKITALLAAVRRHGLEIYHNNEFRSNSDSQPRSIMVQLASPRKGMLLIQGPQSLITQFSRYYGHGRNEPRVDLLPAVRDCRHAGLSRWRRKRHGHHGEAAGGEAVDRAAGAVCGRARGWGRDRGASARGHRAGCCGAAGDGRRAEKKILAGESARRRKSRVVKRARG